MHIHFMGRGFDFFPCHLSSNMQMVINNFFSLKTASISGSFIYPMISRATYQNKIHQDICMRL